MTDTTRRRRLAGGPPEPGLSEASHANGTAKAQVQARLAAAKVSLDGTVQRAQQRVDGLKQEAEAKAASLKLQLSQSKDEFKDRIEDRIKRVKSAYHARGAKLAHAWSLTKEALAVS